MASRRQQSLISSLVIIGTASFLFGAHFVSDLRSPVWFLFKSALPLTTLLFLFCGVILALVIRSKAVVISLTLSLIIHTPLLSPRINGFPTDQLAGDQSRPPQSTEVDLIAASFSAMTRTQNFSDVASLLKNKNPDLICLQEISQPHRQQLLKMVALEYPYNTQNTSNQIILSKYPIEAFADNGHVQVADLKHPQFGVIKIINTHMPRPYLGKNQAWNFLLGHISDTSNTILCGDLNATPTNSIYELLLVGYNLKDSLTAGYGLTYPNAQRRSALFGPLIRIDYIFLRGFEPLYSQTINASKLSDHRAVIAYLAFTGQITEPSINVP